MQVTTDQLFARIGAQSIELDLLRAQNAQQQATIADLLGQVKALRDRQAVPAETTGTGDREDTIRRVFSRNHADVAGDAVARPEPDRNGN
jgi:hypothetical protein